MYSKLAALTDQALFGLKAELDRVIANRQYDLFRVGKQATFAAKSGETIRIVITGRGPKNYKGYRVYPDGRHDMKAKWTVCPEFLKPYFEPPKAVVPPIGTGADKPAMAPMY